MARPKKKGGNKNKPAKKSVAKKITNNKKSKPTKVKAKTKKTRKLKLAPPQVTPVITKEPDNTIFHAAVPEAPYSPEPAPVEAIVPEPVIVAEVPVAKAEPIIVEAPVVVKKPIIVETPKIPIKPKTPVTPRIPSVPPVNPLDGVSNEVKSGAFAMDRAITQHRSAMSKTDVESFLEKNPQIQALAIYSATGFCLDIYEAGKKVLRMPFEGEYPLSV